VIGDSISVYGGFAGTESLLSERDFTANVTVLSGDIGVQNDDNDNSFTVVTESAFHMILDGFTITGGGGSFGGGGVKTNSGYLTLASLVVVNNNAVYGGGMYIFNTFATITNVTLSGNSADQSGGLWLEANGSTGSTPVRAREAFSSWC
jgi:hypothetical protein